MQRESEEGENEMKLQERKEEGEEVEGGQREKKEQEEEEEAEKFDDEKRHTRRTAQEEDILSPLPYPLPPETAPTHGTLPPTSRRPPQSPTSPSYTWGKKRLRTLSMEQEEIREEEEEEEEEEGERKGGGGGEGGRGQNRVS